VPFSDPEKRRQYSREYDKNRWRTDPLYRERKKARYRNRLKTDPGFRKRRTEQARDKYSHDPDNRKRRLDSTLKSASRSEAKKRSCVYMKKYNLLHKKKREIQNRSLRFKRKYGLSAVDWVAMWHSQNGKCPICNQKMVKFGNGRFSACVDHCHSCGLVRGLLCRVCNIHLGWFDRYKELIIRYGHERCDVNPQAKPN
jgi:hypothetical protein